MRKSFWFSLACILIALVIIFAVVVPDAIKCAADGGAYVKAVFWYACIGGNNG